MIDLHRHKCVYYNYFFYIIKKKSKGQLGVYNYYPRYISITHTLVYTYVILYKYHIKILVMSI